MPAGIERGQRHRTLVPGRSIQPGCKTFGGSADGAPGAVPEAVPDAPPRGRALTLPNALTLSRIVAVPLLAFLLWWQIGRAHV